MLQKIQRRATAGLIVVLNGARDAGCASAPLAAATRLVVLAPVARHALRVFSSIFPVPPPSPVSASRSARRAVLSDQHRQSR